MTAPLRLLQVGMGGFGRSWATEVMPQVEGIELVGCVDLAPSSLDRARAVIPLPPDRYYLSLDSALEATEPDAVLVTAAVGGHIPAALTSIAAGRHVLVEKPFAPTLAEAQGAVDAAAAQGVVLMVSQNYRFFPAVRAVQTLVASGEYGPVNSIYLDFRRHDNTLAYGSHPHYHFPQPILVDMAVHHLDLMRAVLGTEPVEVDCRSWNPPWSNYDEPAEAMATLRFAGNTMVSYRGTWLSPGVETPWAGEWRMEFAEVEVAWTSHGSGRALDSADVVTVRRRGEEPRRLDLPVLPHLSREGSLSAFVEAIHSGVEAETSGRRNLNTLALVYAMVQSAETGGPVTL